MSTEAISIIGILLIIWIMFILLDLTISGIVAIILKLSFKKTFLWGLLSLLLPPVMILYGSMIERNIYQVKKAEISFDELPEGFDGYRIVHISDIHARSFTKREKSLQRAVDKINSLNPDLIAFTGDLITLSADELENISGILAQLCAKDGIASVLGNHDYSIYADDKDTASDGPTKVIEIQKDLGWDILLDENRTITRGRDSIAVIGVENTSPSRHFPSKGDLSRASKGTDGTFRIVLTHDPMHWKSEILGKDYPLTLSGHTHAMQFSIFGWSPSRFIFKHHKGLYTEGDQHLYVNTGLGETIFPARIGTPPEITLITLKKAQDQNSVNLAR